MCKLYYSWTDFEPELGRKSACINVRAPTKLDEWIFLRGKFVTLVCRRRKTIDLNDVMSCAGPDSNRTCLFLTAFTWEEVNTWRVVGNPSKKNNWFWYKNLTLVQIHLKCYFIILFRLWSNWVSASIHVLSKNKNKTSIKFWVALLLVQRDSTVDDLRTKQSLDNINILILAVCSFCCCLPTWFTRSLINSKRRKKNLSDWYCR